MHRAFHPRIKNEPLVNFFETLKFIAQTILLFLNRQYLTVKSCLAEWICRDEEPELDFNCAWMLSITCRLFLLWLFMKKILPPFFLPLFFLKAKFKTIILTKVNLVLIFISKYVQWLDWSNILLQNFISSPWSILPDFRSPLSYMLHQPFDEIACHHQRERERKKKKGGRGKSMSLHEVN